MRFGDRSKAAKLTVSPAWPRPPFGLTAGQQFLTYRPVPANEEGKHSPHDPFIFQQLSELEKARPFLQEFLPPLLARKVRWEALELVQSRFVDPQLRSHFSDLVYRAEWEESGEHNKTLFFYLLFEHKSFVDKLAPLQVLVGMVSLWQEWVRERV